MPNSVAAVVRMAMSAIALLILGMFAASGWGAGEVKRNVAVAAVSAADVAGPQLDLENTIKDVQINVIQVQQWLTDISATRGRDGLDDGYAMAEEQARAFVENAAKARQLSRDLGLAELDAALSKVEQAFPAYYTAGRAMAAQYIAGGAEAGNAMMAAFDGTAARLGEELEHVLDRNAAAVEGRRARLDADLAAARRAVDMSNRVVLALGAVALLSIAGFAVVLFRSVVHPFRDATEAARRLAGGDATGEIVVRGGLSEPRALAAGLRTFREGAEVQLAAISALENSLTPMVVTRADGRPILANRAFAGLWSKLDPDARRRWSTGSGEVRDLNYSPLVAAARQGETQGAIRSKPGGRRSVELTCGDAIVEVRMAALSDARGSAGAVIEIEHVAKIRQLEDDFLRVIEHVKAGDFGSRVEEVDDLGFTSTAARGFNTLCESVARFMAELARAVDGLADGDLTVRIAGGFSGCFAEACDGFNQSVTQLSRTVQEVALAAGELNAVAGPIATGARNLASRTESQAAALEQMSATMTELGEALKGNADMAGHAVGLAREAASGAETGAATVAETVEAVTRIEESSNRIRDIVNVIDSIAFQTNLLALNAAVEAARAGDAGKGFAVVASEVRQLAQRSAGAAEEVRKLIEESSAHVADGVRLVKRTGETLGDLEVAVRSVTTTVTDIAQSVTGQAAGLGEIMQATHELDDATQRNASLADESSTAAGRLTQRAERLGELVNAFRLTEERDQRAAASSAAA